MELRVYFEEQAAKMNETHLANLVSMAKVDGHVHEDELEFLYKIGGKYDFSREKIDVMVKTEDNGSTAVPFTHAQRCGQLYDLVLMMLADGIIRKSELDFCEQLAKAFGFESSVIGLMIDYNQRVLCDDTSWEEFLEEVKVQVIEQQ